MSYKVLVVDDDPYILMSLEFLMKKSGYEVLIARNGAEALDHIYKDHPHLILLDIMMPDVDGYEICKTVKTSEDLKDIKVIFLSAKTTEDAIQKGLALGAEKYVTKPFNTKQLVSDVKQLLGA
jgi:DNA-binding response OmpR family regulator